MSVPVEIGKYQILNLGVGERNKGIIWENEIVARILVGTEYDLE